MLLSRVDHTERGQDPYLTWKVRLFAVGATLGLAGIFLDIRALIWSAIAVLVAGFLLRFLPMTRPRSGEDGATTGAAAPSDAGVPSDDHTRSEDGAWPAGDDGPSERAPPERDEPGSP